MERYAMSRERTVPIYFDFISPYAWLALMRAEGFAEQHEIQWQMQPVVYAALLEANGLAGPAETAAKRNYAFRDAVRCAGAAGHRLTGPPEHPFRSLEALRAMWLFREEPAALRLAVALADACWGEGRPLTEPDVIDTVVRAVGLDASGLAERIVAPETKLGLRQATDDAIAAGVFGVPTFAVDDELFWGHDRMDQLARRLAGHGSPDEERVATLLARPRGVRRRGAPPTSS